MSEGSFGRSTVTSSNHGRLRLGAVEALKSSCERFRIRVSAHLAYREEHSHLGILALCQRSHHTRRTRRRLVSRATPQRGDELMVRAVATCTHGRRAGIHCWRQSANTGTPGRVFAEALTNRSSVLPRSQAHGGHGHATPC